ncbi:hypothetical protein VaNZ11_009492 [Volvox africanus]|uniref:tetrahydrofolate synthase n=1 Tax=Volvox africanus TaxID=51714 RepID=A0ABQ5S893_9CHLO|nr:hypothetical protein VaNZ11_009492 [Volvox africanus]
MWLRLIMLQLQSNFRHQISRLGHSFRHIVIMPVALPSEMAPSVATIALPSRRTNDLQAIPHVHADLPGANFHLSHLRTFCAASPSSFPPGPPGTRGDDISEKDWSEVEARLGEMAASKIRPSVSGVRRNEFELMPIFMQRAGLTQERLAALKFIHVAGTKGKGSTCAMVESILRSCGYRTALYTSPHLVDPRERIQVDGKMLPRSAFAASFQRVFGALKAAADNDEKDGPGMPSFFYFLTIMAMDALLARPRHLAPEVVVLEVGIGGRLDATNAVATRGSVAAAAITSLGFDHMELLGDTLPKIAREKAGIMKPDTPVLVAPQEPEAMDVLQEVAVRVGAHLVQPPPLELYRRESPSTTGDAAAARLRFQHPDTSTSRTTVTDDDSEVVVGIGGEHMKVNAALAVALAAEWELQYGAVSTAAAAAAAVEPAVAAARAAAVRSLTLPQEYAMGLRTVRWPGRSQVLHDDEAAAQGGRLTFYLDGAHTPESMAVCGAWFAREVKAAEKAAGSSGDGAADGAAQSSSSCRRRRRHAIVLLFNCMKERDPAVLLPALAATLSTARQTDCQLGAEPPLAAAIFTPMLSGSGVLLPSYDGKQLERPQPAAAVPVTDLTWQLRMRSVWDSLPQPQAPSDTNPVLAATAAAAGAPVAPGLRAGPTSGSGTGGVCEGGYGGMRLHGLPYSSVGESLPAVLGAVRAAAAADPWVHVHVLVTGSLYLVGDMLRLLNKPPL